MERDIARQPTGKDLKQAESARLHWRPESRVFDPAGRRVRNDVPAGGREATFYVPDTPVGAALGSLYRCGKARHGFCVVPRGHHGRLSAARPAQPILRCMTSGTGGAPRLIERSQKSWCDSIAENAGFWRIGISDAYAVLGALSHSLTLYAAAEALHLGADLHLLSGLRPGRQEERLRDGRVSVLYATPAQLRLLAGVSPCVLPDLRLVLVGGARLDAATREKWLKKAPNGPLHEFYGSSETSFVALSDSETPKGSAGRAYPGVSISIRDERGCRLPAGRTGEIWVESPYLFDRYVQGDAGDTRRDGAAVTVGEYGWLDAAGYLWLAGRKGRMVTVADRNVFPEEVETCLLEIPGVERAAALPRPDAMRGEHLIACVETRGDLGDEDILKHCRSRLGPLKAPRRIYRPVPFPVLASGKPDLRALEELRRALQHAVAWCDPIGEGAPVRATPDALAQVNSAYLTICEVLEGE